MSSNPIPIANRERLQGKEFLAGQELTSIDKEARSVDCIFFTGADIARIDYWTGDKYVLRFDPKGGDFSLLNNGAPVLDNHSSYAGSVAQKGKVEKAWQDGKLSKATLRFSRRPDVDGLWQDIQDKIVSKFSMGVQVLREEKFVENNIEVRLAREWQPFEISVAPIPADFGTTTLSADKTRTLAMGSSGPKEIAMPDKVNAPGTEAHPTEATDSATATAEQIYQDQLKSAREAGTIQELVRVTSILDVARILNISQEFAAQHVKAKTTIDKFRELAINEQARKNTEYVDTKTGRVVLVSDEQDTRRTLMGAAIFGMMDPKQRKEDRANPFIGLSIKQIAEESVRFQFNLRRTPTTAEVVQLSMQNTADFSNVLENTARKQMLSSYNYAAPTYRLWTKRSTAPDFKTMTRVRLSEAPQFLKVPEGAQITLGTLSDSKESYALATFGRGVSFTRQMLINDDLGAFNDLIGQFGIQAARLENKTVYGILTTNAAMADNNALFIANPHGNLGTGTIANTGLDAMFTAMGIQKGLDGKTVLNLTPAFLIVPKAKESTARAALMAIGPNVKAADQNWFAGRLTPVADGELDATSILEWYGACDPAFAPAIEYCHLENQEGPQFVRKDNESGILGIQFYAFLDFAAKAVDWRPLYKSSGV
jgi:hypothetical protein